MNDLEKPDFHKGDYLYFRKGNGPVYLLKVTHEPYTREYDNDCYYVPGIALMGERTPAGEKVDWCYDKGRHGYFRKITEEEVVTYLI
mgnify:CR=1 FL=1